MKSLQEHLNEALNVDIKLTDISKLKIGDYVSDGDEKPINEIAQIISLKPIKLKIVKSNSNKHIGKIIDIGSHTGHMELAKVLNPGKIGLNLITKAIKRNYWFVLFGFGDSRSTIYGWTACDKSEYTKSKAKSAGDRVAKSKGKSQFNYFIVEKTYVTDSPDAFLKKCKSVKLNPNLEDYI